MRRIRPALLACLALALGFTPARAQRAPAWKGWDLVLGDWVGGDSRGRPGAATASGFGFHYDLDRHVIVQRNWSEYPAANDHAAFRHEGMMVITATDSGYRAMSYDNEGHEIAYAVTVSDSAVVFVSPAAAAAPRFRLGFRVAPPGLVVRFEIAQPGKPEAFAVYAEGTGRRVQAK